MNIVNFELLWFSWRRFVQ